MKKIILLLLVLFFTFGCFGCFTDTPSDSSPTQSSGSTPEPDPEPQPEEKQVVDLTGQTDLSETVTQANLFANGVQGYYADNDRTAYIVENKNSRLRHELSGNKFVSGLWNTDGEEYLYNTMDSYVVFNGDMYYGSTAKSDARVNTTKLGYYYYSTYIRDMSFDSAIPLHLEKAYHTYSDRMHQQFRIIANGKSAYVTEFGFEVIVKKSNIAAIEIADGDTTVTSLENGTYVYDNCKYVALDNVKAGVVGFITANQNAKVKIEVSKKYYTIRQFVSFDGVVSGAEKTFANRLYVDETHVFDGIRKAAYEEENPLTNENISVEAKDGASFVGYNNLTGAYEFTLDSHGFNEAYFKQPQKKYFETVSVNNVPDDRTIYLSVKTELPLEGAAIADKNDVLLPIPLQVGKNFGHEHEEPIYNPLDTKYGETIMPLSVKPDKQYDFTIVNVYQKWGNFNLKQLSSIEYFISYYHLSTGVTETNCIAPYYSAFANGPCGYAWVLPDFRGCSGDFWADPVKQTGDPQYNSVGTLFAPTDNYGLDMGNYTGSDIASSGLTHADLDYSYLSADGKYRYTMRHVELPQTDESRTYYTIEFTFLEDTDIDNNAFSIVGFDGRKGLYSKAAYLDESGAHREITPAAEKGSQKIYKLHKDGSYFALYGLPSSLNQETGNFGCIVKDYSIKVNGASSDVGLAFLNDYRTNLEFGDLNYASLTLDRSVSFKKGDSISVDVILLPFGTVGQNTCENVVNVYNDSVINALNLTANAGTKVDDTWIPTVMSQNNAAEFTLSGGVSSGTSEVNYVVKAQGFDKLAVPKVYEKINGSWVEYDFATELGYDGYSVVNENGKLTYSFAFTANASGRTFKIIAE